jgi:hypothetical protein
MYCKVKDFFICTGIWLAWITFVWVTNPIFLPSPHNCFKENKQ